jgi:hypothetical protein
MLRKICRKAEFPKKEPASHLLKPENLENAVCNNFIFFSTEQIVRGMIFPRLQGEPGKKSIRAER